MNRRLTSKRLRAALWIAANGKCQIFRMPTKFQLAQNAFVRLSGDDRLEFIA